MRKVLGECLSCGGNIEVTSLSCTRCETEVTGRFAPCRFCDPRPETARFLELFVRNRGNVKEMERVLDIAYWTIRNRINELIAELGFETEEEEDTAQPRHDILAMVHRGELKAGQAAGLLNQIQSRQLFETRPVRDRA